VVIKKKIKVLIVDDSMLFRESLAKGLVADSGLEIVATAADPYAARDKIIEHEPDVMILDVELPRMNGIEFLKKLMPQYPIPVVVVSASGDNVFDALKAGAVDFVTKPSASYGKGLESLIFS
jgi:two-component system chemotaxis response regulator CheB